MSAKVPHSNRVRPVAGSTVPAQMLRRAIAASLVASVLEWFDFIIYGMFAVVIGRLFFPTESAAASLLLSFATFGVGFAMRPLGGVLLGLYGDRVGRNKALALTVTLMAAGTACMAVLPGYAAIGVAAPVLMVLARIVQGFSAGGAFASGTTILIEFAPANRRGLYGSLQAVAAAAAIAGGALAAWLITANLTPAALDAWGWRVPFLIGVLSGPIGWYIHARVDDSPEFRAWLQARRATAPATVGASLGELFRRYPRELVSTMGVVIVNTVALYIVLFFIPAFAEQHFGLAGAGVTLSTFIASLITLAVCPLSGWLSDVYGRKAVFLTGVVFSVCAAWFLYRHFLAAPSFTTLLAAQTGVAFFLGVTWGPQSTAVTEAFPVGVRSTGAAIAYNVAVLLFGGLAPLLNTWLVKATGNVMVPVYYVLIAAVIGFVGAAWLPRICGRSVVQAA
ncbi:MAG: MFS transporter [Gammaproteobacteria bacterium]